MKIPELSFSFKRAMGISGFKNKCENAGCKKGNYRKNI